MNDEDLQVEFDELDRKRDECFDAVVALLAALKAESQVVAAVSHRLFIFSLAHIYEETGEELIVPMTAALLSAYHEIKKAIDNGEQEEEA